MNWNKRLFSKKARSKQCDIHGVVFNAANYLYQTCQKGKETMCKCKSDQDCKEQSEVELVCNRVNNLDSNRCINCGAKAGHKCEIQTN
jgi:hypothetical protein